jgi:hypothetical protein
VPVGGSVTIQQSKEPTGTVPLGTGKFSAVISADQPIAAVANQQLDEEGVGDSQPPFSSYSGASEGATSVMVPSIMYNWFNYYTEIVIQNVGTAQATDIDIQYFPTTYGAGCVAGSESSDMDNSLAQYASVTKSQVNLTALGATGLTGDCEAFNGRFLGSALITADQPIVAVVNEHVQGKLFTYNGFSGGASEVLLPAYMRNYYGYYAAMVIANPGDTDATVDATFSNGDLGVAPTGQETVNAQYTVPAGESITVYEGETGTGTALDNAGYSWGTDYSFFGTVLLESDQPIVAIVNQEAVTASGAQAGTYNGAAVAEGSQKISVPLIQSDFFGYYTSLTIMTVDGTQADLNITYTSDEVFSANPGQSKTYNVSTNANGFINRYEGPGSVNADLLDDDFWLGTNLMGSEWHGFIGSAVIEVTSGSNIVAFVNSEKSVDGMDSMYTYNAFAQ